MKEVTFQCTNQKCKEFDQNPDIFRGCHKCGNNTFQTIILGA